MNLKLAYRPKNFGPDAPHVVLEVVSGLLAGTYGVYVVTNSKGAVRPVGAGRGCTLEEATNAADKYNRTMRAAKDCG